jgi:hypothetical protein
MKTFELTERRKGERKMKTIHAVFLKRTGKVLIGAFSAVAMVFLVGATVQATGQTGQAAKAAVQGNSSQTMVGSGNIYKTTVERHTSGDLSSSDLHQVSLLTSRIVNHLNAAANDLLDENPNGSKSNIERARKLIKIVRDLLPVTTVTTVVTDVNGKEVYRDVDRVQDDRIPLYEEMISMEVVQPILDAKEKAAELKGLRLEDADVIHTSVLADLDYIERKLNRAISLVDKPEDALMQLALAQTQGIEFVVNENDNSLVKAQQALKLAERMVQDGNSEAARQNLQLAQIHLGMYRELMGKDAVVTKEVKQLEDDIAALATKTQGKETAGMIRGFWERAVKLFHQEPGQAHLVNTVSEDRA